MCNQIVFLCGLMPFQFEGKWGYLNNQGVVAIEPQFEYATDFAGCGMASVQSNGKKGYIDTNGKFAIPPQYQLAFAFQENGIAHVRKDGKDFYIDTTGSPIPENSIKEETNSLLGLTKIRVEGKAGCVNREGKITIPPLFDDIWIADTWVQSDDNPILVSIDKKKGYIDLHGNVVIELKYDYKDAMPFSESLAAVRENGKWGFIDRTGSYVSTPQFDNVYSFNHGFALVGLNQKWGYVDSTGRLAIPPQFNSGSDFYEDGLAIVWQQKYCGYIDGTGTFVIPPQFTDANRFQNGLAAVKKNGECGYIDPIGDVVIPFYFSNVGGFSKDGYAVVMVREGCGLIDKTGEWIVSPPCNGLLTNDFFE